jgi:protein-disulfide isomerase
VAVVQGGDGNGGTNPTLNGQIIPPPTANADGSTLGAADAPVTIYEYSDFQCPFCAEAALEVVPQLDTDYLATGKAKFIFKGVNFLGRGGNESRWPAEASLCADDQGKFWEYHNKLFEEQAGENEGTFEVANLKRFAAEIGLNQEEFNTA